jgi:5-dehydro-4-deoxyglucarate dehydratase
VKGTNQMQPEQLKDRLAGIMSFPITPFGSDGGLDVPRFRQHVDYQAETAAAALFVGCGTGELFSLTPAELRTVAQEAAGVSAGRKPVVVGVGYGAAIGAQMASSAREDGADGLLVFPPYMVEGGQEGLRRYYERIAASTDLGIIIYQRDNVRFTSRTLEQLAEIPNVIAFKDGLGDVDLVTRLRLSCGEQLRFMNGLPTAEIAVQAYRAAGVASYSSAVLNFVPEVASAFYTAVEDEDQATVDRILREFFKPLIELRNQVPGYAVALVKAAVGIRQGYAGEPRPPLIAPTPDHLEELSDIIDRGLKCV